MSEFSSPARILSVLGALVLLPGCAPAQQETSGARPVMIYDTATGQLVNSDVYNMRPGNPPGGR